MFITTPRQRHLEWCKKRAIEYLDQGDRTSAWSSMVSDLGKHPETENHSGIMLGNMQVMGGFLRSIPDMRRFIEGFN